MLKAEFPYDPSVIDEGRWREACVEFDAATPVPWALLSGGVDDETFERQVRFACEAGASRVLVGGSVWAEATTMAPKARDGFLVIEDGLGSCAWWGWSRPWARRGVRDEPPPAPGGYARC